jgi:phosphoribosylpyrophosphate synthetase
MSIDPYQNGVGKHLTIIAGTNPEDEETAKEAFEVLERDYGLENITLILNRPITPEIRRLPKDTWPFSYGSFSDGETRFEAGQRSIKDFLDSKHVVFVKHFYSPLSGNKINDNLMEFRCLGSLLNRARQKNVAIPKKFTLASPYLPYVRSHSIEKYEEIGFFQADTLDLITYDWNNAGVDEVIGIDPHSKKIWALLKNYEISYQHIDPFKDPGRKDWRLYGPYTADMDEEKRIENLVKICPFVQYYLENQEKYEGFTLVQPDSGSYERVKEFAFNSSIGLENIIAFRKERDGEGKSRIIGIEHNSRIKDADIKGREFLIIDDLIASGGTGIDTARYLKDRGAKRVHIWVSHNAGSDQTRLSQSEYIDSVVMIDTVRNKESEKFVYLKKSGMMIAGALYKSHMNLVKGSIIGNY